MDTRNLLNDGLNYHKQGMTLLDGLGVDGMEYEDKYYYELLDLVKKGDPCAAEILCLDNLQCYFMEGEEFVLTDYKLDHNYGLALKNGSKYAGLAFLLIAKFQNDQNLINQYAQYASVEEEFAYCKKTAVQPPPSESSPVQPAPTPVSSTPYHLGLSKERLGEHTLEQIKQKIEQGTFDPLTKAWQQGWPEWKVVSDVPEIASLMASQPPPLPDDGPPPL
jgi:hypothetical protein